jgi:hypothetical protein
MFSARRLLSICWQSALAVMTWLVVVPSPARADCGDYVVMGVHGTLGKAHTGQPEHSSDTPVKPCSGPHCSRRSQPIPPLPAPTAPTSSSQEMGLPSVHEGLLAFDHDTAVVSNERATPLFRANSIYHPPR